MNLEIKLRESSSVIRITNLKTITYYELGYNQSESISDKFEDFSLAHVDEYVNFKGSETISVNKADIEYLLFSSNS